MRPRTSYGTALPLQLAEMCEHSAEVVYTGDGNSSIGDSNDHTNTPV